MTAADLARLVKEMRRAQKDYFRLRTPECLEISKALERQVDKAVEVCLSEQMSFFGESHG